jgi:hypothetical protein
MPLNVQTLDVLTALVILGGASAVVVFAILLGQLLERRQTGSSSAVVSADGVAVGPVASGFGPATLSCPGTADAAFTHARMLVMDGGIASSSVQPWRAASARDLGSFATHRHAISHEWIQPESDGLVELYRVGFLLDELAEELDIEPCSIVEELARRVFGATEPVADPHAKRFGQPWTAAELRILRSAVDAGHAVPEISRQLGRDQLSVVFRMLESVADSRDHRADAPLFAPRESTLHS